MKSSDFVLEGKTHDKIKAILDIYIISAYFN